MATTTVKIEGLLGMLTVKLQDDNFVKWSFQFQSVLRGYDLFDHFTGEDPCPPRFVIDTEEGVTNEVNVAYKDWVKKDLALLSLLIATLSDDVMEHIIGCKTACEAWTCLQERFASVSMVRINQLKSELHTIQKGGESVDRFLLRVKAIKDQLVSAGERLTENDFLIAVLSGLPSEFDMIKTVILARDSPISYKDLRAQLLGAEANIESRMKVLSTSMAAMYVHGEGFGSSAFQSHSNSFEVGESSNSHRFQGAYDGDQSNGFRGGSGFMGSGDKFVQRSNFSGGNRRSNSHSNNGNFDHRGTNGSRNFSDSGHQFGNRSNNGSFPGNFSGHGKTFDRQNGSSFSGSGFQKTNTWHGNTTYKSGISPECQICSRRGHTAANCYHRAATGNSGFIACQICGKRGHIALECYHRNNFSYQGNPPPPSLTAMTAQANIGQSAPQNNGHGFSNGETWILDTGATHHMTSNVHSLSQVNPYNGDEKITIGNGEGLAVKNIGSSTITTSTNAFLLHNVLHVPQITVNLLSVKKLCKDNGCWFICDDVAFFIQDKATRVILYQVSRAAY